MNGTAVGKVFVGGILLLGTIIVFASMWVFGWGFFQRSTADFRGETEAIERVQGDGDYRNAAYNAFFDRCASIQSFEDRIRILEDELTGNPTEQRRTEIQSALGAIKAQRAEEVRSYNADAAKDFTAGQFRDADLPHEIDIEGNDTTCATSSN